MAGTELADAFAGASPLRVDPAERPRLEARLSALCEIAEREMPGVAVSRPELARYLGGHAAGEAVLRQGELPESAAGELRLACALRSGDRAAAVLFDERYLRPLETTLARMRLDPSQLDEVKQRVRAKLLVVESNGSMRVEAYAGKGRLGGLLQVVATRAAIDIARDARRVDYDPDALLAAAHGGRDPELEAIRKDARAEFAAAFEAAVSGLETRDKNLLRMHLLGGVTLEQLATMYGVHRATVVRWLAAARARVLTSTKATLRDRLRLRPDELESLLGLVESRLDLSVERLLASRHDDSDDEVHG